MSKTLSITDQLTALEVVNRQGGSEDGRRIIEIMSIINQLMIDAPMMPANDRTVNRAVVRTALPHAEHRIYNAGVGKGASQTKPIEDVICSMAIYSVVDQKLANEAPDKQALLNSENTAFIEGMSQDQAEDFIYGNHARNPEEMYGFAARRNKLGKHCISMGGHNAGHMTSVYIVKWAENKAHLIYPKGAKDCGVERQDRGLQDWEDDNKKKYPAYVNYYQCSYGLAIKDERALIRICNIDTASFDAAELVKKILRAYRILAPGLGTVVVYANSLVLGEIDIATMEKGNIVLSYTDPWGKEITAIRDGRLRQQDAILNTEDEVKA